jgi:soluble lytic murein transglycosylase-like protein
LAASCLFVQPSLAACERDMALAEVMSRAERAQASPADWARDKFALARAHCGDAALGGMPAGDTRFSGTSAADARFSGTPAGATRLSGTPAGATGSSDKPAAQDERPREARQLSLYATPARVTPTARVSGAPSRGPSSLASSTPTDGAAERGASPSPVRGVTPRRHAPRPALVPARAPSKTTLRVQSLADTMARAAARHRLDPLLLHAIASVESNHDATARSPAGAIGVMQVMPETARRFGVMQPERMLHHPTVNINVGAAYLGTLALHYENNLELMLAAYNAGEGAVERYGNRIPPYAETQNYVRRVVDRYEELQVHRRAGRITTRVDTMTQVGGWPAQESSSTSPRRHARSL